LNGKAHEPGARSMDQWLTWFTVDHKQGVAGASLEDSLDGATWHQSSSRLKQNREERMGSLTKDSMGRLIDRVRPAEVNGDSVERSGGGGSVAR
jgi:hypothetical protein